MAALAPPSATRAAAVSSGWGASTGRLSARMHAAPPATATGPEPRRATACPAIGTATITASDMHSTIRPSWRDEKAEPLLDPRDLRDPRADDGPVHHEQAGGGDARAHARST